MSKTYRAILQIKVPTGGFNGSGSGASRYMAEQTITLPVVQDVGGFYNTKALLESAYGVGSVQALYENT